MRAGESEHLLSPFPGGTTSDPDSPYVPSSSAQLAITDRDGEEDVVAGEAQGVGEADEVLLQFRG